jgi:hypothetical protein
VGVKALSTLRLWRASPVQRAAEPIVFGMDGLGDLASRPSPGDETAGSLGSLARWVVELGRSAPGLVESHLPGVGLGARTREQLIVAVADANGCRFLAWAHSAWHEFLGPPVADDAVQPLLDFARASAEAGVPLDATVLAAMFPGSVVRSARATVARAEIGSLVTNHAGRLASQLLSRQVDGPAAVAGQVAAVGMAIPVLVPAAAVAGALKAVVRLAPPLPEPELPPDGEANLVVHLLADALPTYFGNTVVRALLLWNPVVLAIGVRIEGTSATLRVGQGHVAIVNGIRSDALVVVEGGLEPLLQLAAGSIVRQLAVGPRRSRA